MKTLPKILIIAAAVGAFGYGVGEFFSMNPLLMAGAMAGLTLLYGFLLTKQHRAPKEKGFLKNFLTKIPVVAVIAVILWFGSGHFGFPIWWQIKFVSFSMVGMIVFIILDLKTMKVEKGASDSLIRLIGTYALPSVLFITITAQLPQFNPKYEIARLEKKPVTVFVPGPEAIAAGREIFESNKCFNCHKVFWEGNSDRGPNLGTKQIGLYDVEYIKEQILDPRKKQSPGFEDKKSKKAMPTYYGEDLNEAELLSLISYLKTMRDPTHMPVEGKFPNQWTWWDDKQIVEEGKVVFEGKEPATEGLNCAVCHGADGIPMMTGAFDFRKADNPDTDKMADHMNVTLKDFPDELYYKRVTRGVDNTPMAPWGMIFPHLYLWKAEAYARTFHDPLDKRAAKKPVPPIPTKEEIERWKKDGLFLDPLL
jgi:mono/diheme cytochrome c family protein